MSSALIKNILLADKNSSYNKLSNNLNVMFFSPFHYYNHFEQLAATLTAKESLIIWDVPI